MDALNATFHIMIRGIRAALKVNNCPKKHFFIQKIVIIIKFKISTNLIMIETTATTNNIIDLVVCFDGLIDVIESILSSEPTTESEICSSNSKIPWYSRSHPRLSRF